MDFLRISIYVRAQLEAAGTLFWALDYFSGGSARFDISREYEGMKAFNIR